MISTPRWLLALALAGGVTGGGALALQSAPGAPAPTTAVMAEADTVQAPASGVSARVRRLLAEEQAVQRQLAEARRRLHQYLGAGEARVAPDATPAVSAPAATKRVTLPAPGVRGPNASESDDRDAPVEAAQPTRSHSPKPRPTGDDEESTPPSPPPTHGSTGVSGAGGHHGDDGDDGDDDHEQGGDD